MKLSSRAIFRRAKRDERLSKDLGSCRHNAAVVRGANPDSSTCPHRASAARDGVRGDMASERTKRVRQTWLEANEPPQNNCHPCPCRIESSLTQACLFSVRNNEDA